MSSSIGAVTTAHSHLSSQVQEYIWKLYLRLYLRKQISPLLHCLCMVCCVQHAVLKIPAESSERLENSRGKACRLKNWDEVAEWESDTFLAPLINPNREFYCCSLFAQRWIHASTGILSEGLSEQALSCASQNHILPKNIDCESEITELFVFLSFLNVRLGFHKVATNISIPVLEMWSLAAEFGRRCCV